MEFKNKILSNGLSIIGEVNKSAKSAAVGFFVKTGSRDESRQINGVSHFLEHMLFKGTEKLSAREVNEAFDRTGAQFNAFTSEEMTVFYAGILPEYLEEVTGLWAELMRPSLRDDDFNIEKNVIKEEIAMYKDLPSFDVMDRCRSLYFQDHPCANSVLGTEASIDSLTAEQMREYFSRRYAPNNITMVVVGNFDWDSICAVGENGCSKWERQKAARETKDYPGSTGAERLEKANMSREHICLIGPSVSAQDPARFAASILAVIIGDDVGSRFYWELVDKAIAEAASMHAAAMDGTGIFYSYFQCGRENAATVLDIVSGIFEDITANGISEKEMAAAKNKILSALVIKNEVPMGRLVDVGFNWVYCNEYRRIQDDIDAVKAVTASDIKELLNRCSLTDFTQYSIGPTE